MRSDARSELVGFDQVVSTDGDQPAVADPHFPIELKQSFHLAAVLRAEAAAAQNEDHWIRALQLGKLAPLRGVVGQLVVGEGRAGNEVEPLGGILVERAGS